MPAAKNTFEDFKGVKLSEKYDYDPDKHKYAQEPPKAGVGKGTAGRTDKQAAKPDANKKGANQQDSDDGDDPDDDSGDEEVDIHQLKKKILKVAMTHAENLRSRQRRRR